MLPSPVPTDDWWIGMDFRSVMVILCPCRAGAPLDFSLPPAPLCCSPWYLFRAEREGPLLCKGILHLELVSDRHAAKLKLVRSGSLAGASGMLVLYNGHAGLVAWFVIAVSLWRERHQQRLPKHVRIAREGRAHWGTDWALSYPGTTRPGWHGACL